MSRKILFWINSVVAGCIVLAIAASAAYFWMRNDMIAVSETKSKLRALPKNSFVKDASAYANIGKTLSLEFGTPPTQLPNLRPLLVFYGPGDRPDIPKNSTLLYFALANGKSMGSIPEHEKLYVMYDQEETPPQYVFSPGNRPTPLWMEAGLKGKEAQIKVLMQDETGKLVNAPSANAKFPLQEREFTRTAGSSPWEIGQWRVDGTLLARQRARWYGQDVFLDEHGGDEFAEHANKQRVDFGEGEDAYSVYVAKGGALIWKDGQWQSALPGKETLGHPLLQVKKIDERLLTFELWDNEGKHKITLNLLKSKEPWAPQQIEQDFKFVAARTRSQYVFEVQNERVTLHPDDWLVLTEKGWELIDSVEEIDAYVDRKLVGPLFIFKGVVKNDDKQTLAGTLYNATRTEAQTLELAVPQSNVTVINIPKEKIEKASTNDNVFSSEFFQKFHDSLKED